MEETLGKRISGHRKRLGLTQDQLADKLGVTAQAVSKWENDISCPDINMLPRLAEEFGTTTDALLGRAPVFEGEVVEGAQKGHWEFHHNGGRKGTINASVKEKDGWEFHWDSGRRWSVSSAVFVLLVGGLLLTSRILNWDAGFWSIAWPSAMLVYGFTAALRNFNFTNITCTLLGGYFLIDNLGVFPISLDKGLIFPALIVIFGLSLLCDALRKPKKGRFRIHKKGDASHKTTHHMDQEDGHFEASLSFGDKHHTITCPHLRSGKASVSFGEMDLDLTGCGQIENGCRLDMSVSFGEMNLRVPKAYQVKVGAGAAFGDISFHGHPQEETIGTIYLDGGVSFGAMNIYYV